MIISMPRTVLLIISWKCNKLNSCSIKGKITSFSCMKTTKIIASSFNIVKYTVQGQINVAEPESVIIIRKED